MYRKVPFRVPRHSQSRKITTPYQSQRKHMNRIIHGINNLERFFSQARFSVVRRKDYHSDIVSDKPRPEGDEFFNPGTPAFEVDARPCIQVIIHGNNTAQNQQLFQKTQFTRVLDILVKSKNQQDTDQLEIQFSEIVDSSKRGIGDNDDPRLFLP